MAAYKYTLSDSDLNDLVEPAGEVLLEFRYTPLNPRYRMR